MEDLHVVIAGAAGEGLQKVGEILARVVSAQGDLLFEVNAGSTNHPGLRFCSPGIRRGAGSSLRHTGPGNQV